MGLTTAVRPTAGLHLHPPHPPQPACGMAAVAGQDGPGRLGVSRLGSARPTDTMTYIQQLQAAAAAALTSVTSASIHSASTTMGSISSKY